MSLLYVKLYAPSIGAAVECSPRDRTRDKMYCCLRKIFKSSLSDWLRTDNKRGHRQINERCKYPMTIIQVSNRYLSLDSNELLMLEKQRKKSSIDCFGDKIMGLAVTTTFIWWKFGVVFRCELFYWVWIRLFWRRRNILLMLKNTNFLCNWVKIWDTTQKVTQLIIEHFTIYLFSLS